MSSSLQTGSFQVREASGVQRTGLKGRGAGDLLASLGIAVPPRANRVLRFTSPPAGRCLRLGTAEFLLEQDDGDALLLALDTALQATPVNVLGALRRDRCFLLSGTGLAEALRQIAAFDFEGPAFGPDDVVMTLMAGISVCFIREPATGPDALRLWCDAGFGDYLHDCFVALGAQSDTPSLSPHREPQGPPP